MFILGVTQLESESYIMFDFISFTNLRIYPEVNNKQYTQTASGFISVPGRGNLTATQLLL